MRSARLTVPVTPEEKRWIEARARQAGMSAGEFLRQAGLSFDPEIDAAAVQALARELAGTIERIHRSLTTTLAEIVALRDALGDTEGLKAAAVVDIAAGVDSWPFSLADDGCQHPNIARGGRP